MVDQNLVGEAVEEREEQALPQGWAIAKVGDFCKLIGGGTPSTQNESYWQGTIPWITSADIEGITDIRPRKAITARAIRDSATNLVAAGSIIVVTRVGLGKVALVSQPLCFSQDCQALVFDTSIFDPLYLTYYLKSAVQVFKHISRGTTISGVTKKQLQEIDVVIPPNDEQKRIVNAIEMHFTRLDAGIDGLRQTQAKLKRYRSAVLKAAVEGTLTEAWRAEHRDVEPASVLLERMLQERRSVWEQAELAKFARAGKTPPKGWQARYKEPAAPHAGNIPELPAGWCRATMRQVSHFARYGTSAKTSDDASGVPVLRMGNIQQGALDLGDLKYLPATHHEFPDLLLERGDLLFNRTNSAELVGKSAVFKGSPDPCSYASYLIAVRMVTGRLPEFVNAFLNSVYGRSWVASVVSQQVGQANVNGTKLQALTIPLPPLAEHEQIVAEVERRLSVVAETEAQVEADLKRAERLRQSILKQAFAGKLVPQDPEEEPASVLLERIRSQRRVATETGRPQKAVQLRLV